MAGRPTHNLSISFRKSVGRWVIYNFAQKSYNIDFPGRDLWLYPKILFCTCELPRQRSASISQWAIKSCYFKTRSDPIFNPTLTETPGQRCICRDCRTFREMSNCVGASDFCASKRNVLLIVSLPLFNRFGPQTGPSGGAVHGHQVHQRRVPEQPGPSGQRLSRRGYGPPSAATLPLLATWAFHEVSEVACDLHVHFLRYF